MEEFYKPALSFGQVILFYGSPLSGKGTQSQLLGRQLNLPVISSGDVFREFRTDFPDSPLALELATYMDQGLLVPNEIISKVFVNFFIDPKFSKGFILDGFVREESNADLLVDILQTINLNLACTIYLNVEEDELIKRLESRKQVQLRTDDSIEIFKQRYQIFNSNTPNVLTRLKSHGQIITIKQSEKNISTIKSLGFEIESSIKNLFVKKWIGNNLLKFAKLYEELDSQIDQLDKFIKYSLEINEPKRTGVLRSCVLVQTTNSYKFTEFVNDLDKYGIETLILPYNFNPEQYPQIYMEFSNLNNIRLMGIFCEQTSLLKYYCGSIDNSELYSKVHVKDKVKAINYSVLDVHIWDKKTNQIQTLQYTHKTPGYIDLSKKSNFSSNVFGWDDIFVMESNGYTFEELKKFGLKLSSRNMNISKCFTSWLQYKKLVDLKFNSIEPVKSIDFDIDVGQFISTHKYFSNTYCKNAGIYNLFVNTINQGVFFKSASNRRIKNYWYPGLNGGIPLVPKSDEIHECTYMAHDIGHFAIPDLIFTGLSSLYNKQVYICWRMMSEALTMGFADMAFVDTLVNMGFGSNYDYSKRRIYNLFEATGVELNISNRSEYLTNLKKIIWANYRFCLLGDETPYKNLLSENLKSFDTLEQFKEKYTQFFVSDYKWTEFNYKSMESKSNEFRLWYQALEPQIKALGNLYTIDNIVDQLYINYPNYKSNSPDDIFELVFNFIFDNIIVKMFGDTQPEFLHLNTRKYKAFSRYMIGQCMIFFKFYFILESKVYFDNIKQLLWGDNNSQTDIDYNKIQSLYQEYLNILVSKNLISEDDHITYSQVYPLFDPMYLTYDLDNNQTQTIKSIHDKIFNECSDNLIYNTQTHILKNIIELTGGYVEDEIFVIKPGIELIGYAKSPHPNNILTWVITGCSIEASMELIAHKEARVARLTTSKTKAMDKPLYRIYGSVHGVQCDTRFQKEIIKQIQMIRTKWSHSQGSKTIPQEIFNMSNCGNKCTALVYSMSLSDLHKLFIGRAGYNGNESEVRDIIQVMISQAHEKFPDYIWSYSEYLNSSNGSKYNLSQDNQITIPNSDFKTDLTPLAIKLFTSLNIDMETPDYIQMAEFRSRITYMTFPSKKSKSGLEYIRKIVCELSHTSVLDGFQFVSDDQIKTCKELFVDKKLII